MCSIVEQDFIDLPWPRAWRFRGVIEDHHYLFAFDAGELAEEVVDGVLSTVSSAST